MRHASGNTPKSSRRQAAGFTLIEFLIAATLLALMAGAVFGGLQIALNSYTRSQDRIEADSRRRVLEDMVRHQIGSLFPLLPPLDLNRLGQEMQNVDPAALQRQQPQSLMRGPLFYGTSESMTFLTVSPFDMRLSPGLTVVRYGMADDEYGTPYFGAMERQYNGLASFYEMVEVPAGTPISVIHGIKELHFSYFGFDEQTQVGEWYDEWMGQDALAPPRAIRITADDIQIVVMVNAISGGIGGAQNPDIRKLFGST